jgi:hypothetical protein
MSRVYISYSHKDSEYVRRLANAIRTLGHEPFYSEESLSPGQPFQAILSKNLREAEGIVFVLSEHSLESRYVMTEIGAALGYFEERGRPLLLPVVIDGSALPTQISHIHALFVRDQDVEDVALEIASALERVAGRQQAREEKKEEVRSRVETNASIFIEKSLIDLKNRESQYRRAAKYWYGVAYGTLAIGLAIALWRALTLPGHLSNWFDLAGFAAIGAVVLGLLVAVARFAFMLGKSYMVEALRNSDRIHAISFGEFYLRAFPDQLEWSQVKDAFQHWNIDKGSSFLGQTSQDFDIEVFKAAVAIAESLKTSKEKKDK